MSSPAPTFRLPDALHGSLCRNQKALSSVQILHFPVPEVKILSHMHQIKNRNLFHHNMDLSMPIQIHLTFYYFPSEAYCLHSLKAQFLLPQSSLPVWLPHLMSLLKLFRFRLQERSCLTSVPSKSYLLRSPMLTELQFQPVNVPVLSFSV